MVYGYNINNMPLNDWRPDSCDVIVGIEEIVTKFVEHLQPPVLVKFIGA